MGMMKVGRGTRVRTGLLRGKCDDAVAVVMPPLLLLLLLLRCCCCGDHGERASVNCSAAVVVTLLL